MPANSDLLQAALIGYQAELTRIEQTMADIRRKLKPAARKAPAAPTGKRARRKMSAAGRKRIIAALKKRWAAYHKQKSAKV